MDPLAAAVVRLKRPLHDRVLLQACDLEVYGPRFRSSNRAVRGMKEPIENGSYAFHTCGQLCGKVPRRARANRRTPDLQRLNTNVFRTGIRAQETQ